jgi:hypothetical protein
MLLERFLVRERVEEKLASFFVLLASPRVRDVLRHIISPFFIQLCQLLEFFLEVSLIRGTILGLVKTRLLFEDRVGLKLLLNDIFELQGRRLQNLQTLLQLRSKNLLQSDSLYLLHSWARHKMSVTE